jgi:dephospho-CoA kinase
MIVCLTGGIGSGKTSVSDMFLKLGIPVYISDIEARKLMESSKEIKELIIKEFGKASYTNEQPNRKYLASVVFNDKEKLKILNHIIHPQVAIHFKKWYAKQKSHYVIKESAVLFESEGYKDCNKIILVIAPEKERMNRVMKRDNVSRKEVLIRIKNQWKDKEKRKFSDYVIKNIDLAKTNFQVLKVHEELLKIGEIE